MEAKYMKEEGISEWTSKLCTKPKQLQTKRLGVFTIYMENLEIPVGKSNGTHHIPFGLLLQLWASGQSDTFLLLLLRFTAEVHTFCMLFCMFCMFLFRQAKSFRIDAENFHPGGLRKW